MTPLLTITQQQLIKPISPNWAAKIKQTSGVTNYDQLALEVEESKIQPLLGAALLQDLQDNPTSAENVILLDGGTYENCNGDTIKFKGIRYILAYYNFSQLVSESFVADTYTGFVKKDRQETETLSSSERKEIKINAERNASIQWKLLKQFLNENCDTYPLWHVEQSRSPKRGRLTGIKRTIN